MIKTTIRSGNEVFFVLHLRIPGVRLRLAALVSTLAICIRKNVKDEKCRKVIKPRFSPEGHAMTSTK